MCGTIRGLNGETPTRTSSFSEIYDDKNSAVIFSIPFHFNMSVVLRSVIKYRFLWEWVGSQRGNRNRSAKPKNWPYIFFSRRSLCGLLTALWEEESPCLFASLSGGRKRKRKHINVHSFFLFFWTFPHLWPPQLDVKLGKNLSAKKNRWMLTVCKICRGNCWSCCLYF